MPYKVISVPLKGGEEFEAELNSFLSGHRVLGVKRKLVEEETGWVWSFCVDYIERGAAGKVAAPAGDGGRGKVDYQKVLSKEEFALFCKIKRVRKDLADAEKVPLYAIVNNEQVAAIARARPKSQEALGKVEGIGGERLKKYGKALLGALMPEAEWVVESSVGGDGA